MRITSVNIGTRQQLNGKHFNGETGIFKRPSKGAVRIDELGLESDAVVNTKHHGGPDQAVYLYRSEDYDWWSDMLGHEVKPGSFGDNLTLQGLVEPGIRIGTRLHFAEVELEVTAPRIPCNTLATRMGDPEFVRSFVEAERPGIYCRVIVTGNIESGETFTIDDSNASPLTTVDLFRASYRKLQRDEVEQFLAAPIDIRTRTKFEKQLTV